jgi:hypothetical protein
MLTGPNGSNGSSDGTLVLLDGDTLNRGDVWAGLGARPRRRVLAYSAPRGVSLLSFHLLHDDRQCLSGGYLVTGALWYRKQPNAL